MIKGTRPYGSGGGGIDLGSMGSAAIQYTETAAQKAANDKDFTQLQDRVKKSYGFTLDQSLRGIDYEAVKQNVAALEEIHVNFPGFKRFTQNATLRTQDQNTDAIAYVYRGDTSIYVNSAYFQDYKALNTINEAMATRGWFANGSNGKSTVHHEAGHAVVNAIWQKEGGRGDSMQTAASICQAAARSDLVRSYMKRNNIKNVGEMYASVSRYGCTNWHELCAESVSDYMSSHKGASVMAQAIVAEMKRRMNG